MVLVIVPSGLKGVLKFEFIYTFQFGKGVLVAFCTGNFKINVIVASRYNPGTEYFKIDVIVVVDRSPMYLLV